MGSVEPRLQAYPARLQTLSALVVDDNPAAREILADALGGIAQRVDVVASGREAVAAVKRQDTTEPYDVVFMDWQMPAWTGSPRHGRSKRMPTWRISRR